MKGGIRISQVSLILIWLVCAIVLALSWKRTIILTSVIPYQTPIAQVDSERSLSESLSVERMKPKATEYFSDISSTIEAPVVREQAKNMSAAAGKEATHSGSHEWEVVVLKSNSEVGLEKENSIEVVKGLREEPRNLSTTIHEVSDCDYAKGKWIFDDNRPLYSGFGCKQWLSSMWACRLTQRTDFEYEKLRWQPKDCAMKDFSGSKFLERMQDKTLAFVGDSLGRQQFQSLMCMVTGGKETLDVVDVGSEYGLVKSAGATRPDGWAYRFPSTNTTILFQWSASLCDLEPVKNSSKRNSEIAMHLDRPTAFLRQFLHRFDVLVLNTGHHWNRGKLNANRWIMYVGGAPNTNRKIASIGGAKNYTVHSIVRWVDLQLSLHPGLRVFLRSISPRHFFNGEWNTGGTCDNTTPLSSGKEVLKNESSDSVASSAVRGTRVKLLDITGMSELRDEGHVSRYSIKASPGVQDCLHWCLPGVPDTWNEVLFAHL